MVRRDLWKYDNEESLSNQDLLKVKYQVEIFLIILFHHQSWTVIFLVTFSEGKC